MVKYIAKRLTTMMPLLLAISFITFMLGSVSSGDTARMLAEKEYEKPTPEQIEIVRIKMGLDRPALVQYGSWLAKALSGDFGRSFKSGKPVVREMASLFPKTLQLALFTMLFLILIALPLGVVSAALPGGALDKMVRGYCFFSASMPQFWFSLLALLLLGAKLGFVSVLGGSSMTYPLLPALTIAICTGGIHLRIVRTNVEEALGKGYIRAARAKGLSGFTVITKHALKNASLPIITDFAMSFSSCLAGSSIIETIFSWNGLGKFALGAIKTKDFPVVQGYVLFMAFVVVAINLIADIVCGVADPRIKTGKR